MADASDIFLEELDTELQRVQDAFTYDLMVKHKQIGDTASVHIFADLTKQVVAHLL